MSEPRTPFLRRWSVAVAYVLLSTVVTAIGGGLFAGGDRSASVVLGVGILLLGPIGLLAMLVLALPLSVVTVSSAGATGSIAPEVTSGAVVAVVALIVGFVNVLIVRRWARRATERAASGVPNARRVSIDRGVGAILFGFAGAGFVVLSVLAGIEAATANGIDTGPLPNARAMVLVAAICWWTGLGSAVAGLVLWIVLRIRGRAILPWAIADVAILTAANVVCFVVDSALSS